MADLIYSATLDDKQVLQALQRIDKNIDRIASEADKNFQKIGKSAGASGVQIGAIAGIVSSLTTKFIELGHRMVAALSQGIQESVTLASNLETTEAIFTGIFQGNEAAAMGTLARIRKESRELGVDLSETARAFLPFVENLDQLTKIGKIGAALAISQPEQGELGARIALQEFLSGSAQSLVRRFEIPKNLGKELNEALATGGIEEGIKKLEEVLTRMGRNVDQLGDTFQLSLGKARISAEQLQTAFGVPILDELKAQFDELNVIVAENFDDYTLIADTFGRILAHIVDIIGSGLTDFLANLDTEQVIEIGETLFDLVENARLFSEILLGTEVPQDLLDGVQTIVESLNEAIETQIKLSAMSKAEEARARAEAAVLADTVREHGKEAGTEWLNNFLAQVAEAEPSFIAQPTLALAPILGDAEAQATALEAAAAGEKAYQAAIEDSLEAINASKKAKEDNRKATDDLAASQKESTESGEAEANAFLAQEAAARALADAKEAAAAAQAKIDKAMADAQQDFARKLEDIDIAAERKRLDIQIEFAQKREDAARNNLQKLADIQLKSRQDITDAATDLERKEEDIARKFANERIDLERDQRKSRLDIETSFRQKLEDIQKQSAFDLEEAERNRDAVGFLRIIRQQQQQVSTAQTDRQRELDELRVNGELKKEELRIQQQREIEEARIANEQKLEDLRLNLERQIEAQNTAYARQIEDIAINEARKNEEAARARDRDIEDAKLAYDRKLADLQVSLADELAIIAAGNAAIEEEAKRHADEMAAIAAEERASAPVSDTGRPSSRPGAQNRQRQYASQPGSRPGAINQGRAFGGLVNAGQTYNVHPPELFTPSSNGKIIPSSALVLPSMMPKNVVNNISNSKTNAPAVNFPVGDASLFNDPIFVAKLRNTILSTIDEVG